MEDTIIQDNGIYTGKETLSAGDALQQGKYAIIKILGKGGFGITYLARHTMLNKLVAIKEFYPSAFCNRDSYTHVITPATASAVSTVQNLKNKFKKEAIALAGIRDNNIVAVHELFEENNTAYFVMDYIEGKTLSALISERGCLTEHDAVRYILYICHALQAVHGKYINHFDIKPANIMIRSSDDQAVLIDFGTAKQYEDAGDETTSTMPSFTERYAPPEQYQVGGLTSFSPQTDIYALGATLYAALTGKKPPLYSEIMEQGLQGLPPNISAGTANAVRWALTPTRKDRPADITIFAQALTAKPKVKPSRKTRSKTTTSSSSHVWLWIVAAILGAIGGYALQLFCAQGIYDNLDVPELLAIWLIPILLVVGLVLSYVFMSSKPAKNGLMCFLLFAAAGAAICELANPTETDAGTYPLTLKGESVMNDCTAELGISQQLYPKEDFTISMSENGVFIVQNSEGYVRCTYQGEVADGYGKIRFDDFVSGSFDYEDPEWRSAVVKLLKGVRSWDTRNDMRRGNMVSYFYNNDGEILIKVYQ